MADNSEKPEKTKLPSPADFFLSVPLYKAFPIDESDGNPFYSLEYFKDTIDCYCEGCGRHSVFTCRERSYRSPPISYRNYFFSHWLTCSRNEQHIIVFLFWANNGQLLKIGQYPSLADLATPDLQKYRKALGEERYRELTKGIGLASHGVGIGAFVYLRRVFESLIENAHDVAKEDSDWNEKAFQANRMDEKIAVLRAHLPPFLVENRTLYGILSKGIHSLTEEECLTAFPVVKLGIELILDEELERIVKEEKVKSARKEIGALNGIIKRGEIKQ